MAVTNSPSDLTTEWEQEIRVREDGARRAFLAADTETLDTVWSDEFIVNSPLNQLIAKRQLLELVRSGRIRHLTYESEIEHMSKYGDFVIVMGHETVADPPDGKPFRRRYTNIWHREAGTWRTIARHAHVVAGSATG